MVSTPRYSVVIPTRHRNDALAECLARLAPGAQTLAAGNYEVIVADDGDFPTAEAMIRERFAWARWTAGPRRGPAANRNHGAGQARGAWLVFTDDDCVPEPEWLAAYHGIVGQEPGAQLMEGRTLASGRRPSSDSEAPINAHGGFLWSCNFAIDRGLFAEIGGFDPAFPGPTMEDVDLRLRLSEKNVRPLFAPGALVLHPWRKRRGNNFVRVYAKSVDYFLTKHPHEAKFFSVGVQARVWLQSTLRNAREGIVHCGGRGVARMAWLEFYAFVLLARGAVRRAYRRSG